LLPLCCAEPFFRLTGRKSGASPFRYLRTVHRPGLDGLLLPGASRASRGGRGGAVQRAFTTASWRIRLCCQTLEGLQQHIWRPWRDIFSGNDGVVPERLIAATRRRNGHSLHRAKCDHESLASISGLSSWRFLHRLRSVNSALRGQSGHDHAGRTPALMTQAV
jgi:hypothetical protein